MTDHCFKPVRARTMTYSFTRYLSKVTRSKVKVKVTGSLVVMCKTCSMQVYTVIILIIIIIIITIMMTCVSEGDRKHQTGR